MSTPKIPGPATLVVSVLTPDKKIVDSASTTLVRQMGPIEHTTGPLAFDYTSYYEKEMGPGIQRWIWAFSNLVDRGDLAKIKCLTNEVESAYSEQGRRRFNLDPGLLTLENFVLATGKNQAHRIYLADGIFGDLTLVFRKGSYRPLEWTYPDYADSRLIEILNALRETFRCKLKQLGKGTAPSGA